MTHISQRYLQAVAIRLEGQDSLRRVEQNAQVGDIGEQVQRGDEQNAFI